MHTIFASPLYYEWKHERRRDKERKGAAWKHNHSLSLI